MKNLSKDFKIIKALEELGLRKEKELTADELEMFQRAVNPEDFFLNDVEKLFKGEE